MGSVQKFMSKRGGSLSKLYGKGGRKGLKPESHEGGEEYERQGKGLASRLRY